MTGQQRALSQMLYLSPEPSSAAARMLHLAAGRFSCFFLVVLQQSGHLCVMSAYIPVCHTSPQVRGPFKRHGFVSFIHTAGPDCCDRRALDLPVWWPRFVGAAYCPETKNRRALNRRIIPQDLCSIPHICLTESIILVLSCETSCSSGSRLMPEGLNSVVVRSCSDLSIDLKPCLNSSPDTCS